MSTKTYIFDLKNLKNNKYVLGVIFKVEVTPFFADFRRKFFFLNYHLKLLPINQSIIVMCQNKHKDLCFIFINMFLGDKNFSQEVFQIFHCA